MERDALDAEDTRVLEEDDVVRRIRIEALEAIGRRQERVAADQSARAELAVLERDELAHFRERSRRRDAVDDAWRKRGSKLEKARRAGVERCLRAGRCGCDRDRERTRGQTQRDGPRA